MPANIKGAQRIASPGLSAPPIVDTEGDKPAVTVMRTVRRVNFVHLSHKLRSKESPGVWQSRS